jgi:hypothetical protein
MCREGHQLLTKEGPVKAIRIYRAKPNPFGKDRVGGTTPAKQLAGEWIDLESIGDETIYLGGLTLYHTAYQPGCRDPKWEAVIALSGSLLPGQVLRVHSGHELSTYQMNPEDVAGADRRLFTNRNYVWNNRCGDEAGIYDGQVFVDKAWYQPNPTEGRILVRQGDKLV